MAYLDRRKEIYDPDKYQKTSVYKKLKEKRIFKKTLPKAARDAEEIERLNRLCQDLSSFSDMELFASFPISTYSHKGLSECGYTKPTDVQKQTIGLALRGCDVLGAAKTGSGKTLAFLIPVLEQLYRNRWSKDDGLGALIITPVRELAYQIFEILKIVGKYHYFSAGLVIGGQNLNYEKDRINLCNIMICTPGRLLQHMDENPLFDAANLKILVLDEADRILDMGFTKVMDSIFENLSTERQTLLFSATQTKSVKDLARVSLKDPVYVSVHEHSVYSTPDNLQQSYVICELENKMDMLWSFLCHHQLKKILVFVTCCKQVIYILKAFKRLKCRFKLYGLHGGMHQEKRLHTYEKFCTGEHGVLLATDVASRGLDFPAVDWVVQLDCPEDIKAYIHRVGRTARFEAGGEALLVLMPSEEEAMLEHLKERNIPITKILLNPQKQFCLKNKLCATVAANPELKEFAQRAFGVYLKSIFLMKDKKMFDVTKIDTDAFASSLGLIMKPQMRFIQRRTKIMEDAKTRRAAKLAEKLKLGQQSGETDSAKNGEASEEESPEPAPKLHPLIESDAEHSSDDDLFTVKRVLQPDEIGHDLDDGELEYPKPKAKTKVLTKPAKAKKLINKKIKPNTKTTFNEDGEEVVDVPKRQVTEAARVAEITGEGDVPCGINFKLSAAIMQEEYRVDKGLFHKRVHQQHKEKRHREREEMRLQYADRNNEEHQPPRLAVSDDEGSVDLSYLPDPDLLYGPEGGAAASVATTDASSEEEEEEEDKQTSSSKKRKSKATKKKFLPVKKKVRVQESSSEDDSDSSEYAPPGTEMTLQEDEELALRLLND